MFKSFFDLQKFRTEYIFMFLPSKQKDDISSRPIKLDFKISARFGVANHALCVLVLTPKLTRTSKNGQRHFGLSKTNNKISFKKTFMEMVVSS